MNRIRLLFSGLVVIILGLAGGTGYLIYERIQDEVGVKQQATQQEVQLLREEQKKTRQDVLSLKDRVTKAEARLKVLTAEASTAKFERGVLKDETIELRKNTDANREIIELNEKRLDEYDEKIASVEG